MTIKKLLRPQLLFPIVISAVLVIALICAATIPHGPTFKMVKTETPGSMSMSWANISEEEFYREMALAAYVEYKSGPEYYDLTQPGDSYSMPITVYAFNPGDILARPRNGALETKEDGTILIHSISDAFSGISGNPDEDLYIMFLSDQRDYPNLEPRTDVSPAYYDDYVDAFGYALITPFVSIIPARYMEQFGMIAMETNRLPEYLRGEGYYTTIEELRNILTAGRTKYGMSEYVPPADPS